MGSRAPGYSDREMPTSVDRDLQRMVAAFRTNEHVEAVVRREQKRDEALIRLADDVHMQRIQLARDIRDYLYRLVGRSDRPSPRRLPLVPAPARWRGPSVREVPGRPSLGSELRLAGGSRRAALRAESHGRLQSPR